MSQQLISRSPDLLRLQNAGYAVRVTGGMVVIDAVPYVATDGSVQRGSLVSELTVAGDTTQRPSTHVASFVGGIPCDQHGAPLSKLINSTRQRDLGHGLVAACTFSSKPPKGYDDYEHKMVTYISILEGFARVVEADATARTFPVVAQADQSSPFVYVDTASSRAGINTINSHLANQRVAIVGLGGTGAYVLDLVSKTPAAGVHLFDGDRLLQHNAFRAPGAISLEQLEAAPTKVDFYARTYGEMRTDITAHSVFVDASTLDLLDGMDFVFLAIDAGQAKKEIVEYLLRSGIAFVDTGIGVYEVDGRLAGTIRTTTASSEKSDHIEGRISFSDMPAGDYSTNIQIADLNALAASLAVVRWKRLSGFYNDLDREHHSVYDIDGNTVTNAEHS